MQEMLLFKPVIHLAINRESFFEIDDIYLMCPSILIKILIILCGISMNANALDAIDMLKNRAYVVMCSAQCDARWSYSRPALRVVQIVMHNTCIRCYYFSGLIVQSGVTLWSHQHARLTKEENADYFLARISTILQMNKILEQNSSNGLAAFLARD